MTEMWRDTFVEIYLSNLEHNAKTLKALAGEGRFFCPMIKANAYGHGDVAVAGVLEKSGIGAAGVSLVEEGVRLRESGVRMPLYVFGGFDPESAEACFRYDLTPVLGSFHHLAAFHRSIPDKSGFRVHVKFNTGMARLGFEPEEASKIADWFSKQTRLTLDGVCTHLLNGQDTGDRAGFTTRQVLLFSEIRQHFPGVRYHWKNSAGLLLGGDPQSGARPGISLYGIKPPLDRQTDVELRPGLSWKSRIAFLHRLKAGESVSYGATWKAQRDSWIGVLPVGYADGYPRALSNSGQVLVRGVRVPVTGIVCMDYILLDLTDLPNEPPALFEEAVLLGRQKQEEISADELARLAGTIPYEIVTRIGARVPRTHVRT